MNERLNLAQMHPDEEVAAYSMVRGRLLAEMEHYLEGPEGSEKSVYDITKLEDREAFATFAAGVFVQLITEDPETRVRPRERA